MTISRRSFLQGLGLSLGGAVLAGCDSQGPRWARGGLALAGRANERVERGLFRTGSRDSVPADAALAGAAFPVYFIAPSIPVWDAAARGAWALEVGGLVRQPLSLTLEALQRMPSVTQRVNHYCVEGWNARAEWTGVRVKDLAAAAGVLPEAQCVDFASFDAGYHESWDLESALHPQTLIAYAMDGRMLGPEHGAPARVHSPVKLGYKNTKYLTRLSFMPAPNGGYWSDQGYEWYGGT